MKWKKTCRCGCPLNFSSEDLKTGMPAEGADFWCSDPKPELGPHDWGIVAYQDDEPVTRGVRS